MQTLVLGGNGFIGSHLVDSLLERGNRVRVYDRGPEKFREPLPEVDYCFGEFDNSSLLAEALNGVDVVFHLISTTVPATSNIDPIADIKGNLVNTVNLLELMHKQSISRIVYLSSGGTVYGNPQMVPIKESHPLNPISSYGVVKVAIEKYLHMFSELYGIGYTALRASNPYGSRQGHAGLQGVIGTFINRLIDERPLEVWGTGEVIRDFIYIDDLARLCAIAGESHVSGCFNAGYGEGASILQIVDIFSEYLGVNMALEFKPGRSFDVPNAVLDISHTCETFDWKPEVELFNGIARTLQFSEVNFPESLRCQILKAA